MAKITEDQKRELVRLTPSVTRIYDDRVPHLLADGTTVMRDKRTWQAYDPATGEEITNYSDTTETSGPSYTHPRETSPRR